MKKITRQINMFNVWSNSWFTEQVIEYEVITKLYQWVKEINGSTMYFVKIRW